MGITQRRIQRHAGRRVREPGRAGPTASAGVPARYRGHARGRDARRTQGGGARFWCRSGGGPEAVAASARTPHPLTVLQLGSIPDNAPLTGFPIWLGHLA